MKFSTFEHINGNNKLEICFKDLYSLDDAKTLLNNLKAKFKNIAVDYKDGIWYDSWTIDINSFTFNLIRHDDEGIYFVAANSRDNEILKELIYKNLM